MKIRFAPTVAFLSVLAFLAWIYVGGRSDPVAIEGEAPPAVSASELSDDAPVLSDEEPVLREQAGGSAVPCAIPLGWRIARLDESFELSLAEVRAALDKAATIRS